MPLVTAPHARVHTRARARTHTHLHIDLPIRKALDLDGSKLHSQVVGHLGCKALHVCACVCVRACVRMPGSSLRLLLALVNICLHVRARVPSGSVCTCMQCLCLCVRVYGHMCTQRLCRFTGGLCMCVTTYACSAHMVSPTWFAEPENTRSLVGGGVVLGPSMRPRNCCSYVDVARMGLLGMTPDVYW